MASPLQSDKIRRAVSCADTGQAVSELAMSLQADENDLVLCFAGQNHDPEKLEALFQEYFGDTRLVACRSAGEITPQGYFDNSLTAVVLPAAHFTAEITRLDELQTASLGTASETAIKAYKNLQTRISDGFSSKNCFAMLLIDGLSQREETIAAGLSLGLTGMPMFGGSSADSLDYKDAWIYHQHAMHSDTAVLILIHTLLPFRVFKTEHFTCTSETYIATSVNARKRIIMEVDGYPAAQWYANTVGVDISDLSADVFSRNPVTVCSGGKTYVRSIQCIEENQGLRFYCAINEGMVLHLGRRSNLVENLRDRLTSIADEVGEIELLIGCDCTLRNLEAKKDKLMPELDRLFRKYNGIGFATFGEQHNGIHINQTFTGVAIGSDAGTD